MGAEQMEPLQSTGIAAKDETSEPVPIPILMQKSPTLAESKTSPLKFLFRMRWSALLFVFLFWLAAVQVPGYVGPFPGFIGPPLMDASWKQALGYALLNHWQAGVDYVFTYGPLGYFATGTYDGSLFWWMIGWECVAKLILALLFYANLSQVRAAWFKWVFLALFVLLPINNSDAFCPADLLYPLGLVLLYLTAIRGEQASVWRTLLAASLCAVISLVKFTFFILAICVILALSLRLLVQRPGHYRWLALLPVTIFLVVFLGVWLALGQEVQNLLPFFAGSLQIASGHTEAMHWDGNPAELKLALWIFAAFLGLVVTSGAKNLSNFRHLTTAAFLGLSLFLLWKQGFVRHEWFHTISFFAYTLCLAFLVPVAFPQCAWRSPFRVGLLVCAILLSTIGVMRGLTGLSAVRGRELLSDAVTHARRDLATLVAPVAYRDHQEALLANRKQKYALPAIAAMVGDSPIDFISSEPGILLLNNMRWRPRPAFQSYLAYTPYLQALNAHRFQSAQAPPYLLISLKAIDFRFPCLEDGPALLEILARYEPALIEKQFLLLKRRQGASPGLDWKPARTRLVKFGQQVVIDSPPKTRQAVTIKVGQSWWGKMASILYKPPSVWLLVRTSTNEILKFRLIPAMASSRFLLNPLVLDTEDFSDQFSERPARRVESLTILTQGKAWFQGGIAVTVEDCSSPSAIMPSRIPVPRHGAGPANSPTAAR
jgi:hypothetical protein